MLPYYKHHYLIGCDLAGIQTLDLQNRNLTLYSAKLRGHSNGKGKHSWRYGVLCQGSKFIFIVQNRA